MMKKLPDSAPLCPTTALIVVSLALGAMGCDAPPTCEVLGELEGAVTAPLDWSLEGAASCGLARTSAFEAEGPVLVFLPVSEETVELIVKIETTEIGVGEFPAQVLFVIEGELFESEPQGCTVVLTSYSVEPWSKTDFIVFEGIVDCPAPLAAASGGASLTMATTGLSGRFLDKELSYEYL